MMELKIRRTEKPAANFSIGAIDLTHLLIFCVLLEIPTKCRFLLQKSGQKRHSGSVGKGDEP